MKNFFLLFLLFSFMLTLSGCGKSPTATPSLPQNGCYLLEGEIEGKAFSAELRGGVLHYREPSSLSGLSVSPDGSAGSGERQLPTSLPGLVLPLCMLGADYELSGHGTGELGGRLCSYVTLIGDLGICRVWLAKDGTPLSFCGSYDGLEAEFSITPLSEN